jgi:hypothetical protein
MIAHEMEQCIVMSVSLETAFLQKGVFGNVSTAMFR